MYRIKYDRCPVQLHTLLLIVLVYWYRIGRDSITYKFTFSEFGTYRVHFLHSCLLVSTCYILLLYGFFLFFGVHVLNNIRLFNFSDRLLSSHSTCLRKYLKIRCTRPSTRCWPRPKPTRRTFCKLLNCKSVSRITTHRRTSVSQVPSSWNTSPDLRWRCAFLVTNSIVMKPR